MGITDRLGLSSNTHFAASMNALRLRIENRIVLEGKNLSGYGLGRRSQNLVPSPCWEEAPGSNSEAVLHSASTVGWGELLYLQDQALVDLLLARADGLSRCSNEDGHEFTDLPI